MPFEFEIDAKNNPPLGMPIQLFFDRYWQKQPVLIRNAFAQFEVPIEANDLAGLATEEFALARLIRQDPMTKHFDVKHAPLSEADFDTLPKTHWTLLVQDCDKWFAQIGELFKSFRFLPRWRLDDIMISWATAHGGVGAHVDQYDVFLLQGMGQRQWEIDARANPPLEFVPDVPLKLLREFNPSHSWTLNPGDMLYLPPNVPHNGVALNNCMTISIGLRAPSIAESLMDFAESMQDVLPEELRYSDTDLKTQSHSAAIDSSAVEKFRSLLRQQLEAKDDQFERWLGRFLTRYRSAMDAAPLEGIINAQQIVEQLRSGSSLRVFPFSRYAFQLTQNGARLFFAGNVFDASIKLANLFDQSDEISLAAFMDLSASDQVVVQKLLQQGHLALHLPGDEP